MSKITGKSPAYTATLFDIAELNKQLESLMPIEKQIIEQVEAAALRGEIVRLVSGEKTIAFLDASVFFPRGFDFTGVRIDEANSITTRIATRTEQKQNT